MPQLLPALPAPDEHSGSTPLSAYAKVCVVPVVVKNSCHREGFARRIGDCIQNLPRGKSPLLELLICHG